MRRSFVYSGFTLLEIMVVVAIIGILTVAVALSLGRSSTTSRNVERQNDLRNLQTAIEAYKNEHGRYPAQCPTSGASADGWSGQVGTNYECTGGSREYIVGLVPDFISRLPVDPKLPSGRTDVGYVYRTNTDGSVYKIMAMNTVEDDAGLVQSDANDRQGLIHPFKSCDVRGRVDSTGLVTNYVAGLSMCHSEFNGSAWPTIPRCRENSTRFQTSYGLWGGFALTDPGTGISLPFDDNAERMRVRYTVDVVCK